MSRKPTKPTFRLLDMLQLAYDHFNRSLFDDQLSDCILTLQREKLTMGYFSRNRWLDTQNGKKIHELAVNPSYFAKFPLMEVLQTLCHEQVHLWQFEHGTPGRARYHNKEWADKMEALGLMPSSTGKPGGKRTGDHMADYVISGGAFEKECVTLIGKGFMLPFIDRIAITPKTPPIDLDLDRVEEIMEALESGGDDSELLEVAPEQNATVVPFASPERVISALSTPASAYIEDAVDDEQIALAAKKQKATYRCGCGNTVWGKPGLHIICDDCDNFFEAS